MEIKVETLTARQAQGVVKSSGLDGYGYRERIDQYKEWMLGGKWSLFYNGTDSKFINDPLIFLPNGILYEGKHRVIALAELPDDFAAEFWVLRDFTAVETFRRWLEDLKTNRLPKNNWQPRPLPPHPRATLGGKGAETPG